MARLFGKWQKGNYNTLTSAEMAIAFPLAALGVKKPTALELHPSGKKWRQYHKPIQPGEFWD